jgi:hypothetical protein
MTKFDDEVDGSERWEGTMPLSSADEERILERTLAVFRGRMKVWVALMWLFAVIWTAVAVWSAAAFFRGETTRDWILYATVLVVSTLAISLLKIWFWMEMNRYSHTREIKRLELQVAKIVQRLGEQEP